MLQVVGGHGAIKKDAVWLRVGMIVALLGESGKLLLTNDGSDQGDAAYVCSGDETVGDVRE